MPEAAIQKEDQASGLLKAKQTAQNHEIDRQLVPRQGHKQATNDQCCESEVAHEDSP